MPPQNQIGVVSIQDLSDLFRDFLAAFGPMNEAPDPIEEQLAYVIPGQGEEVKIPFMPVSNAPSVRNKGDKRGFTDQVEEYACVIKHAPIYPERVRVLYDTVMGSRLQFQMFSDMLNEMLLTAPAVWREILAQTMSAAAGIGLGGGAITALNSYNNTSFFNAAHPVNPLRPELKTQPNQLTGVTMDKAVAVRAIKLLDNMKGHDGRRINRSMRNLVLVVPNEDLRVRANEVWTAEAIAQAVGANAAVVVENQLVKNGGRPIKIVKFEELSDFSDKTCYLLDLTNPRARAFAVSKARNITPFYTGLNPDDQVRRENLSVEAGYDAYGGAGVMLHQRAIMIQEK